ncbi:ATP-binding protein [Desulfosporosinus acidiphilus]|uniref:ATP-binding protein n=1 Tax=Desulfosporosinus acidiphilus TaxID=885581 RepID=UPI000257AFB1|nr:ATP-binding protein [Desulfosporosinus acidiphilus]
MKTLDEFQFGRLEHVSESFIWELASCDYIKKRQNIVMIGNPGSGKTHLSIGLGLKACYAGFNVKFYTAVNLASTLAEAIQFHRLSKLEKSLAKVDLLVIDELSYLTFNRHQSEMLFQVISEGSERASVIITTNLEFSSWTDLFENEIMVAALIDRVTFRSYFEHECKGFLPA